MTRRLMRARKSRSSDSSLSYSFACAHAASAASGSREPSRRRVSAVRLRSLARYSVARRRPSLSGPAVISFRRRYHCPALGCLFNRSRDCTRSRVPPLRVGAMLTLLRVPFLAARPVSGLRFRAAHTLLFYVDDGTSAPRAQSFLTRPATSAPLITRVSPRASLGAPSQPSAFGAAARPDRPRYVGASGLKSTEPSASFPAQCARHRD